MRRCGIEIEEVSLLGVPLPFLPSFRWYRGGIRWSVNLLLIGAYVKPLIPEDIERKASGTSLYIYANGVTANIVYALALLAVAGALTDVQDGHLLKAAVGVVSLGGIACLLWYGRRFVALALPALFAPILLLIGYSLVSVSPIEAMKEGSGGPISVFAGLGGAQTLKDALSFAAFLSLNLAVINLAPLLPLDGGRMAGVILQRFLGKRVERCGAGSPSRSLWRSSSYALGLDVLRVRSWF